MTIIVKQVYWYISQISGEHLQDQWFSGLKDEAQALEVILVTQISSDLR